MAAAGERVDAERSEHRVEVIDGGRLVEGNGDTVRVDAPDVHPTCQRGGDDRIGAARGPYRHCVEIRRVLDGGAIDPCHRIRERGGKRVDT